MSNTNKIISIPVLNDYIYTVLFQASYEQKRGLKGKYLKAAMSAKSAKSFASNSTREEKEMMLAHFGLEYFYVISPKSLGFQKLKDILKKFEKNKKISAIKDIAEEGVYVTSDVEFLKLLGYMSQAIHHPSFFLNLEINRQGYHIQKWAKNNFNQNDFLIREVSENAIRLSRTALAMDFSMTYSQGLTGVHPNELRILLYLYSRSNISISDEALLDYFNGKMKPLQFRYAIKSLCKSQCIKRSINAADKAEYSIAGAGVSHVNHFINNSISQNDF